MIFLYGDSHINKLLNGCDTINYHLGGKTMHRIGRYNKVR